MKRVSIIIPTFNRSNYMLKRSLLSCINQTYKNLEIIVIDDNIRSEISRDVKKVIDKIDDPRVILIKNQGNIGGAASRNKGIELSKGDYISFLDDDDFYLNNKVQKQVNYLEDTNYDFIISNLAIVDNELILKDIRKYPWFKKNMDNEKLITEHYKNHLTGTPTFLFKKELLTDINGFPNVSIGHEFHLVDSALRKGYKMGYLNEILTVAVIHNEERISNNKNRQSELDKLLMFKLNNRKQLSRTDANSIYHRYYLTKAYNYLTEKKYFRTIYYILKSFIYNPIKFLSEIRKRIQIKIITRGGRKWKIEQ